MSDVVDRAGEVIEAAREAGLARVQAALSGAGEVLCQACGEEIEPDRRAALPSAVRCRECQERREKQGRPAAAPSFAGVVAALVGRA